MKVVMFLALLVIFFVPALVWITVIAGIYQLIREGIKDLR